MKKLTKAVFVLSVLGAALPAQSAIIQSIGSGSAVTRIDASADFESIASLTAAPYVENGLVFSRVNLTDNNNGCGFAGCTSAKGLAHFSGNFLFGSGYPGRPGDAYLSISSGADTFTGLEFIVGNGQAGNKASSQNVYWSAYLDGALVSQGSVLNVAAGTVVGFSGLSGFNELRYTDKLVSPTMAPALDSVRAQFAPVPVPAAIPLFTSALAVWFGLRKRREV